MVEKEITSFDQTCKKRKNQHKFTFWLKNLAHKWRKPNIIQICDKTCVIAYQSFKSANVVSAEAKNQHSGANYTHDNCTRHCANFVSKLTCISQDTYLLYTIQCDTVHYKATSCNTMQYNENAMQYQYNIIRYNTIP